jgi:ABC-type Fe3+-hydroxamate transport system substrate-binding protein
MRSTRLAALAAAVALCSVAGCGGDDPPATSGGDAVTVRAENGAVRIDGRPKRIVSISPTATENLFAVGAGKQVVAVDEFSKYPQSAPRTKLSYINPSAEAISAYDPDLVVIALESNKVVPSLERLEIPVLVHRPARDLAEAYSQIETLGVATGHRDKARGVVNRMKARVAEIVRRLGSKPRGLSVYHELDPHYFSASSDTFIGRIYKLVGLRNIADRATKGGEFPKLSAEYVVRANPDLIVLADTICCGQSLASLEKRPGLRDVAAVRNGNVLGVPDDLASHWGPRIVDFLDRVARQVEAVRGSS